MTGLSNGDAYTFTVTATNGHGPGAPSTTSAPVTPAGRPGAPVGVTTKAKSGAVQVSWSPAAANGTPITKYVVVSTPTAKTCTTSGSGRSCTVTGLANGTPYTFTVHARNTRGTGTPSAPTTPVTPASPPTAAPTITTASAGNQSVTLHWDPVPAATDGGAPFTGYVLHAKIGSATKGKATVGPTATTGTVSGLKNGTTYKVTVAAKNTAGTGPAATSNELTPTTRPGQPPNVTAEAADQSALVMWTAATPHGSKITSYTATSTTSKHYSCTATTALTCYVYGLANGTSYRFAVHATNATGPGQTSTPTTPAVTPAVLPTAPLDVAGAPGNASATVTWEAATGNGKAITGYTVTSSPTTLHCTTGGTGKSCTVTGLRNGTMYTFRVRATTAVGTGPSSAPSVAVKPVTVPDAPYTLTVTPGDEQVKVTWKTVTGGTGGTPVASYTVTSTPTGRTCHQTQPKTRSCTVDDLVNGQTYRFRVEATNGAGKSIWSTLSLTAVPATRPTSGPTIESVTSVTTALTVTLHKLPTADDGGNAVAYYDVKYSGTLPTGKAYSGGSFEIPTTGATPVSGTKAGLPYGVPLKITVTAHNAYGTSPTTTWSSTYTLVSTPSAPQDVVATAGYEKAEVSWYDPLDALTGTPTPVQVNNADNGTPITGYIVTSTTRGYDCTTPTATDNACYVNGLTDGQKYSFTVVAVNKQGTGEAAATATVQPTTLPTAPANITATPHDASANVEWTTSATSHGSQITDYIVTASSTTASCEQQTAPCTVTSLQNGKPYAFRVRAVNATGKGPRSYDSNIVVPYTTPDAPTTVRATVGKAAGTVKITWKKPADNGSTVTGYTVTSYPTGRTCTITSASTLTCSLSTLVDGRTYRFTVTARNQAGTGPAATVNAVPYYRPTGAPKGVTGSSGNGSITVTWKPLTPATDGGKAVTKYVVKAEIGTTVKKTVTVVAPATTTTITGLTNGTSYVATVAAANTAGTSTQTAATPALTPSTVPGPPKNVAAYPGNKTTTFIWTAASDNGTPITTYTVISKTKQYSCTWTARTTSADALTCTITHLENGTTYGFWITATNGRGPGTASTLVTATPSTYAGPPVTVTAIAHNGSAAVSWQPPATSSGVTGYTVTSKPLDGKVTDKTCSTTASTLTCSVAGLANGTTYTFRVQARNATGLGPPSAPSNEVVPSELPTAPTTVTASASTSGPGKARVSWKAPTDNGTPITTYMVTSHVATRTIPTIAKTCTPTKTSLTCTVTGLTDGISYYFTVRATNDQGTGPASSPSPTVTPYSTPLAGPVLTNGSSTNQSVTVTWKPLTPATDGGTAINGYLVKAEVGSTVKGETTVGPTATTGTVATLVNGTGYTVTVAATNPRGTGPATTYSSALAPSTVPVAPTTVTATPGNDEAKVLWHASGNGGSPVTSYTATSNTDAHSCTWTSAHTSATSLTCTVTGLTNGTKYRFRVTATNVRGTSQTSATSPTVTPEPLPAAPTGVSATAQDDSATVTWTAPGTTGGSSITGYRVETLQTTAVVRPTCTATGVHTACTVNGLTNGEHYTFRVQAENAYGYGPLSAASNKISPWAVPGAPVNVKATASNASATVTWTRPAVNFTAITSYVVTSTTGKHTCTTTGALTCKVTGLTNGTPYTFVVAAKTRTGTGPPSASSNQVTPSSGTTPKPPKSTTPTKPTTPSKAAPSQGYWEVASDGGLFSFGTAQFYGSMGGKPLNQPIVGMAAMPTGKGYWEVASDGGLFSFGTAEFEGSMGGQPLNKPIVGMTATPTGKGYWEVASDGGLFAFGNAGFYGSMGGQHLDQPIVGMTATPTGKGYWEVASDGGLFAFGNAGFYGSMGGQPLNKPIVGMTATPTGKGYWEVASDGGLFSFGTAEFEGSMGGKPLVKPIVGMAQVP